MYKTSRVYLPSLCSLANTNYLSPALFGFVMFLDVHFILCRYIKFFFLRPNTSHFQLAQFEASHLLSPRFSFSIPSYMLSYIINHLYPCLVVCTVHLTVGSIFYLYLYIYKTHKVVISGALFLFRDCRNHLRYSLHLPTEGWPG